jgi:hypothetical protein
VENFREWRSNYPASTTFEFREIRGSGDFWVVYVTEGFEPPEWRAEWRAAP